MTPRAALRAADSRLEQVDAARTASAGWWAAWLSLAASGGTVLCCALPALLVSLGLGAALAGLVSAAPALVWVSEYKGPVFALAAGLLAAAGALQWRLRTAPCPVDPVLRQACLRTRRWSRWVWLVAVTLFALGALFAFVVPLWMGVEVG